MIRSAKSSFLSIIPSDYKLVGGMVKNICFGNARDCFGLELAPEFSK